MDFKRILTSFLGLPIVVLIIIFGNNTVIDIFFGIVAIIAMRIFWGI